MLIFLASMSMVIADASIAESHHHSMGPVPTRLVQIGGAACPAGEFQVATAWSKGKISLTSLTFNGKDIHPAGLDRLDNALIDFYGLRKVEVGCFSKEIFTVSIYGDKPDMSNVNVTFLYSNNKVTLVP